MTVEYLILDRQMLTLFSESKTMSKLTCQMLLSIMKLFEEVLCMYAARGV